VEIPSRQLGGNVGILRQEFLPSPSGNIQMTLILPIKTEARSDIDILDTKKFSNSTRRKITTQEL
jgi:hypothetical protein